MRKTILFALVATAACGDPETNDNRGYTKAPLEKATVLVQGEPKSAMDALGNPAMPEAPLIEAEEEAKDTAAKPTTTAKAGTPPAGATAADVTAGQTIFTSTGNCYTCHGQTGQGSALAPALNDNQWIHIDGSYAALQQIINAGVPAPKQFPAAMPAKGGAPLTDAQVKQVAAYVYSLSH